MKILHVIHSDLKFAEGAARFIEKCNKKDNHYILYVNTGNTDSLLLNDIKTKQKEIQLRNRYEWLEFARMVKIFEEFDFAIFHSLFLYYWLRLFIAFDRKLSGKIIWIGFGGDLYVSAGLINKIRMIPNKIIANRCYAYIGIFPPDCDEFKRRFPKSNAITFYARYIVGEEPKEYLYYTPYSKIEETYKNGGELTILIGNSASRSMGHIDVLNKLKKFSKERIKIIIPLSYGDSDYADEVEKTANSIFEEKAVCLRHFMKEDDYFEYLKCVDIGIFNVYRQQALGNIYRLIFRNVKLYMPKDSVMYKYFIEEGIPIQEMESIGRDTFEIFRKPVKHINEKKFKEFLLPFEDEKIEQERWEKIYQQLENQI